MMYVDTRGALFISNDVLVHKREFTEEQLIEAKKNDRIISDYVRMSPFENVMWFIGKNFPKGKIKY
ncbi:MAG: hypothetical protein KKH44_03800 [Bacteroidetes bacterium]|nr:hypothetical protein [Bacteroidota bacterium]